MNDNIHGIRPFLLVEGGPLYSIEQRVGLIRNNRFRLKRRAVLATLLTWVPLLILSLFRHTAYGGDIALPFLWDFSVHARFLLAVPLLLLAESTIGPRVAEAASQFVISGVVTEADHDRFESAVERGLRLRDSIIAEVIIIALALSISVTSFLNTAVHVSTWYELRSATGSTVTPAGWWYMGICMPLLQFLLLRWIWRLFLWFQFLATMCSLDLQLFPIHPDGAGGLMFIGQAQQFFGLLLFANSIAICGVTANQIVYDKLPWQHFVPILTAYVIIVVGMIAGPLFVFSGRLFRVRREGILQYGVLGTRYTAAFHERWITGKSPSDGPLLGTGDIQSLADLANSFAIIQKMNVFPMNPQNLIQLIVASLLPMSFLLLAIMPVKDLLRLLLKFLL